MAKCVKIEKILPRTSFDGKDGKGRRSYSLPALSLVAVQDKGHPAGRLREPH